MMRILIGAGLLLAAVPVLAQAQQQQTDTQRLGDKVENVVRQPVRDVGLMRENPPEVLKDAQRAPYSLAGIKRCHDIRRAIGELDVVLGPDVDAVDEKGDALPERLAEMFRFYGLAGRLVLTPEGESFAGQVEAGLAATQAQRLLIWSPSALPTSPGWLAGLLAAQAGLEAPGLVSPDMPSALDFALLGGFIAIAHVARV